MPIQRSTTPAADPVAVSHAPPGVPEQGSVELELSVHKRYTLHDGVHNKLYEAGMIYRFTPAMAEFMLTRRSDLGLPIFKRYVPRLKLPVNNEGRSVMDMTSADLPPRIGAIKEQEARTAEELAELAGEGLIEDGVEV